MCQDEVVLDSNKTTLCLDPLIFSEWLSSKSGKDKFADEAIIAIQEECETEILKIFELANIRSRNEANVARLNSFIAKSCQPIGLATDGEWEAAGVNLDETIEGGDIQSAYKAIVTAAKSWSNIVATNYMRTHHFIL